MRRTWASMWSLFLQRDLRSWVRLQLGYGPLIPIIPPWLTLPSSAFTLAPSHTRHAGHQRAHQACQLAANVGCSCMSNNAFPRGQPRIKCPSVCLRDCDVLLLKKNGGKKTASGRGGQSKRGWRISHSLSNTCPNTKRHHSSIVFRAKLVWKDLWAWAYWVFIDHLKM